MNYSTPSRDSLGGIIEAYREQLSASFPLTRTDSDFMQICGQCHSSINSNPCKKAHLDLDPNAKASNVTMALHFESDCLFMSQLSSQSDNGNDGSSWKCLFCGVLRTTKQGVLNHFHDKHLDDIKLRCSYRPCAFTGTLEEVKVHQLQVHILDNLEIIEIPVNGQEEVLVGVTALEKYVRNQGKNNRRRPPVFLNITHCTRHVQDQAENRELIVLMWIIKMTCKKREQLCLPPQDS